MKTRCIYWYLHSHPPIPLPPSVCHTKMNCKYLKWLVISGRSFYPAVPSDIQLLNKNAMNSHPYLLPSLQDVEMVETVEYHGLGYQSISISGVNKMSFQAKYNSNNQIISTHCLLTSAIFSQTLRWNSWMILWNRSRQVTNQTQRLFQHRLLTSTIFLQTLSDDAFVYHDIGWGKFQGKRTGRFDTLFTHIHHLLIHWTMVMISVQARFKAKKNRFKHIGYLHPPSN